MKIDRRKITATAGSAATAAALLGKKLGREIAVRTDDVLSRAGDAAHRRMRRRARGSALRSLGKLALVTGAGVGVVYASRAIVRRNGGASRKRSSRASSR